MKSLSPENRLSIQSLSVLCGALLTSTILLSISSAQAASPFTTEGKFSVGSDGSANYSIPIVVPPGTAGMQPQLALNYNSNGGNGIVGMGWGIDGLSQISRCPTTLEQDGVINGVNYTSTDRFCLDGQRLIATTDTYNTTTKQYATTSAYGANGTEYRTESANFAKIISYGQAGTGPAYFKVWTKSGQIIEYGNTVDSGIEAQGKPTIRTWGVNKISDTKGNYIAVTYTEDNANGEAYVQRVDYTGNASSTPALTPYANVQFIYETRPDTNTAYQAGSILKTTKRLTNIQTFNGTTQLKNYKLAYEISQSTNRSRLKTVQECDALAPSCKQPVLIEWQNGVVGFNFDNRKYYPNITPFTWAWRQLADVNGDGMDDLILWHNTSYGIYVIPGSTAGFDYAARKYYSNATPFGWKERLLGDVNGDGIADLVLYNDTSTGVYLIPGSPTGFDFAARKYYASSTPFGWKERQLGDVNGDGLADLVIYNDNSTGIYLIRGTPAGFDLASRKYYANSTPFGWKERQLGDVNGDGMDDLILWHDSNYGVYLVPGSSTGFDYGARQYYSNATPFSWRERQFADINGDGNADMVFYNGTSYGIYSVLSNGSGLDFSLKKYHSEATPFSWSQREFSDLDLDGKQDLISWHNTSYGIYTVPSEGSGFDFSLKKYYSELTPFSWRERQIGDVNGDGIPDLVLYNTTSEGIYLILGEGQYPDIVSSINSDTSANTSLSFKPITDTSIYVKDTIGATSISSCPMPVGDDEVANSYPIVNMQIPAYVVSSTEISDGIGGVVTTNYQYGGLKSHVRGRGSLGFRYVKESSPDSGLSVTTFYRQDFPFIGLPCQVEKRRLSDNALLSVVQNTYANSDLATSTIISKFPYLSQSVEQAYELDSSLVSTTTTTNQYDDYGNVTSVKVDDGLGNIKTTTSTYNNNVGNWLLGRLIRSTVISVTP